MAKAKTPKDLKKEIQELKKEITALKKESIAPNISGENRSILMNNQELFIDATLFHWLFESKIVKVADRKSVIESALNIGLLAKMNGKVSATLKRFQGELESEISTIQAYMETFEGKFRKDTELKTNLENEILRELERYSNSMGYGDSFKNTGAITEDGTSKRGDVLSTIVVDEIPRDKLIVEVKFAQEYSLGDKRNVTTKGIRAETANVYEQVLSSRDNRGSEFAIFVIDKELNPIDLGGRPIVFIPEINGFIVTVEVEKADYTALETCYELARSMTLGKQTLDFDYAVLSFLLKDLNETMSRQKHIREAGTTIINEIETNHTKTITKVAETLKLFDAELAGTKLAIENTEKLLKKFFETGKLTSNELYEHYTKRFENPVYKAAKNEAEQWAKSVSERHQITRNYLLQKLNSDDDRSSSDQRQDEQEGDDTQTATITDEDKEPDSSSIQEEDLDKLSVAELKERCKSLGLPVSGKKAELIQRINTSFADDS